MRCRSASHAGVELGYKTKLLDAENVLMTQAYLGKCGRERNCSRGELQVTVYIPDGSALAVQSSMRHSHPLPSAASPLPVCAAVISATAVADVSVLTTDVQTPACSSSRPRVLVPQPTCSTAQASPAAGAGRAVDDDATAPATSWTVRSELKNHSNFELSAASCFRRA